MCESGHLDNPVAAAATAPALLYLPAFLQVARRDSNSYILVVVLYALPSTAVPDAVYLLLPWSRTFRHLTARDGGNAKDCWEQSLPCRSHGGQRCRHFQRLQVIENEGKRKPRFSLSVL